MQYTEFGVMGNQGPYKYRPVCVVVYLAWLSAVCQHSISEEKLSSTASFFKIKSNDWDWFHLLKWRESTNEICRRHQYEIYP